MSLINDALRKSLQERSEGGARQLTDNALSAPVIQLAKPPIALLVGLAVLGGLTGGAGTFWVLSTQSDTESPPVVAADTETPQHAEPASPEPAMTVVTAPDLDEPPPEAPSPPEPVVTALPVTESEEAPGENPSPGEQAAASAAKRRADINEYLDRMNISGTRLAGADSKLLADGKVFRLHDVVMPQHELRLHDIEAHRLTFIDDAGVKYRRSY